MGNLVMADTKQKPVWSTARGKVAALSRSRAADDPELVAARQDLKTGMLEEHIRQAVNSWPPLRAEQLDKLAVLLRPVAGGDR